MARDTASRTSGGWPDERARTHEASDTRSGSAREAFAGPRGGGFGGSATQVNDSHDRYAFGGGNGRGAATDDFEARDPGKARGRHGATAVPGETRGAHDAAGHNVNQVERLLSLAAGGALAWWGLKRRDVTGLGAGVMGGMLVERGVSGQCNVYEALGVSSAGGSTERITRLHGGEGTVDASRATKIERAFTINDRTPDELYAYWRKLENLPRIFRHLESVRELDARRSHWKAKGPAGVSVEWDAEIVNEVPGRIIAWKSIAGARVPNAGAVNFREAPGGRGTEVKVTLEYEPPAGKLGVAVARLFGEEPAIQVREDLRRFKALMEAGEIPVSENPGQGERARQSFDAEVNRGVTGGDVKGLQREALADAHQPRHQPTPADATRGANTTHDYQEPRS